MRRQFSTLLIVLSATLLLFTTSSRSEDASRIVICSLIDRAATQHSIPATFLTRLIWRESSFRSDARSRAGAKGIAQFMPMTADERGLVDPFDPETAIPASAHYLSELRDRFGSLDLAAAAYNAGPGRVARWRSGKAGLPPETREHVRFVMGHTFDGPRPNSAEAVETADRDCLTTLATIQVRGVTKPRGGFADAVAPWGIQLVAGPSKTEALENFQTLQKRYGSLLAGFSPTIITTTIGGRDHRSYFRIRIAFGDRASADRLCRKMRSSGANCLTVRN